MAHDEASDGIRPLPPSPPDPLAVWLAHMVAWWMVLHSIHDGWRYHDIFLATVGLGFLTATLSWRH